MQVEFEDEYGRKTLISVDDTQGMLRVYIKVDKTAQAFSITKRQAQELGKPLVGRSHKTSYKVGRKTRKI